jgi:TatD DNase family protein
MKIQNLKYIDCHSHPHDEKYKQENIDIDQVLINLKNDGGATIGIGTDYENSEKAIELALKHQNVWATIGIHPADNHAEIFDEEKFEELLGKSKDKNGKFKVVGIGECGLDYFYFDKMFRTTTPEVSNETSTPSKEGELRTIEQKIEQEKERQKKLFKNQINFAIKNNLPLVIHGRPSKNSMDAYRDILDILESFVDPSQAQDDRKKLCGHAHFFVGNLEIAKRFLNLGFLLSFDGPITFTTEYDEVIKFVPIEKIMIETDSPYATPMPYRGKINYPEYVKFVAEKIGKLKNLSTEEVLEITKNNVIKLFNL